jgi:hypothetical protein
VRPKTFQAKHIDDRAMLKVVDILAHQYKNLNASRWDVVDAFKPIPWKIVNAKLCALVKRKLINGCGACTCRGSFELTDAGRALLAEYEAVTGL